VTDTEAGGPVAATADTTADTTADVLVADEDEQSEATTASSPAVDPSDGEGATAADGDGDDGSDPRQGGLLPPKLRLVSLTFLMLFLELALIRWLGANVVYMSYYSNFVLLGSFLGFGLGFLWAGRWRKSGRSTPSIFWLTPLLLGGLIAFVYVYDVPLRWTNRDVIFFETIEPDSPLPREVVLLVLFVTVAAIMAAIGDGVARTFGRFEPLEAYRLDLIGSVAGIAGFSLLAFLGARPLVWGLVATLVLALTLPLRGLAGARRFAVPAAAAVGTIVLIAPLAVEAVDHEVVWSPYYRITYEPSEDGGIFTKVNQSPHWAQIVTEGNALYDGAVYENMRQTQGGDVLVIGAGSGNDIAAALRRDADHVDAVEIDHRLMQLAEDNHPERPYDDPRVDVHIDDGRAFLERSGDQWDRILLALPDSLALVQGQSAIRLESYLFTVEALEAAKEHLRPGGVFVMYNFYRQDWLVDRYANTLAEVFDQPVCVNRIGGANLSVLTASDDAAALDCPSARTWQATSSPEPVYDDHPFPYVRDRAIPGLYLVTGLVMLAISLLGIRLMGGPLRAVSRYGDLFFMGVAFMLLETKSVAQFALLFGTTWFVNALVFLGVLVSVLVAVAVSRRVTFRRPARLYVVLLAALVLAFAVPQDQLLDLAVVPRFAAAVTLAFFPIFTANLVFTQRFKDSGSSTVAFGANLLGAMVGGVLEYTALITGFRWLLILVAVAYGLAFLTGRKHLSPA
jgi:SAM-dependent methyltransferase